MTRTLCHTCCFSLVRSVAATLSSAVFHSFAAQPVVLSKLMLLFLYSYLLSLGGLVWAGRDKSRKEFVDGARVGEVQQPCLFTTIHYLLARWVLYGNCLGALLVLGGLVGYYTRLLGALLWVAALIIALWQERFRGAPELKISSSHGTPNPNYYFHFRVPKCLKSVIVKKGDRLHALWMPMPLNEDCWRSLECLPLALPTLAGAVYLPAGGLLLAMVAASYAGAARILKLALPPSTSTVEVPPIAMSKECLNTSSAPVPHAPLPPPSALAEDIRILKDRVAALQVRAGIPLASPREATFRNIDQDKSEEASIRHPAPMATHPTQMAKGAGAVPDSLAEPLRAVLGWLSSVREFPIADGLAKRMTRHDRVQRRRPACAS